eukprot:6799577-Prymnesium_polylepis.1
MVKAKSVLRSPPSCGGGRATRGPPALTTTAILRPPAHNAPAVPLTCIRPDSSAHLRLWTPALH